MKKDVLPGQGALLQGADPDPFPCGSVIVNGNNLHLSGRREVIIARKFDVPVPESHFDDIPWTRLWIVATSDFSGAGE